MKKPHKLFVHTHSLSLSHLTDQIRFQPFSKMYASKTLTLLVSSAVILTITSFHKAFAYGGGGGSNANNIYSPCSDTKIQRSDGFTFGIAFSSRPSFFLNQTVLLSPCDRRLSLAAMNSQLSLFRPKIDEISLLSINTSAFFPDNYGGYMVAFAGRKYAARSPPAFIANSTFIVTSFTLVMEFQKGRLQNLYWKRDGCASCKGNQNFVCLNRQDCAIRTPSCKGRGGSVDCSLGIQLAFSGTDKHLAVLNSWYEVENLKQYSLYGLYSNLKSSLTNQFNNFF